MSSLGSVDPDECRRDSSCARLVHVADTLGESGECALSWKNLPRNLNQQAASHT